MFADGEYDTSYLEGFFQRLDADALIQEIHDASGETIDGVGIESIQIEDSTELKVLSPSTGIFYLKPAPAEPDYTHVGAVVSADEILCQLEAFKVFAPLRLQSFNTADHELYSTDGRYEIKRINVETGQQVNTGDLLFIVDPK